MTMSPEETGRRIRRLQMVVGGLVLITLVEGAQRILRPEANAKVVSVRQLRITDSLGQARLVLGAPLPDPRVQGKAYPRARPVPGMMFLDGSGNESGGIGLFDDLDGGGLCFDYATAEAVCLTKAPTLGFVGLTILDRPAPDAAVGRTGAARIELSLAKGTSQLVLADPSGRPRIRLLVDSVGNASIQRLDTLGRVSSAERERPQRR